MAYISLCAPLLLLRGTAAARSEGLLTVEAEPRVHTIATWTYFPFFDHLPTYLCVDIFNPKTMAKTEIIYL